MQLKTIKTIICNNISGCDDGGLDHISAKAMPEDSRESGYEACYAQSKLIIKDLLADLTEAQWSLQSVQNARLWIEQN